MCFRSGKQQPADLVTSSPLSCLRAASAGHLTQQNVYISSDSCGDTSRLYSRFPPKSMPARVAQQVIRDMRLLDASPKCAPALGLPRCTFHDEMSLRRRSRCSAGVPKCSLIFTRHVLVQPLVVVWQALCCGHRWLSASFICVLVTVSCSMN